jgi:uncharacterized protein with HEPN domain
MSRSHPLRVADYLQHILEAISHIQDYTAQHASVPWGFAYEMRNALAHGYFTVDLGIVWQTIQNDLPVLQAQVAKLRP